MMKAVTWETGACRKPLSGGCRARGVRLMNRSSRARTEVACSLGLSWDSHLFVRRLLVKERAVPKTEGRMGRDGPVYRTLLARRDLCSFIVQRSNIVVPRYSCCNNWRWPQSTADYFTDSRLALVRDAGDAALYSPKIGAKRPASGLDADINVSTQISR